ncbi:MAG TPA: hypothetical protein VGR16_05490 [Thermomicrobiales bacterium]|nr:hypothetical protein [Thermomicrobiales bacterium]
MGTTSTAWPPDSHEGYDRLNGSAVYSGDQERLGRLVQIYHPREEMPQARGEHIFRVRSDPTANPFGAKDAYIPEMAVQTVEGHRMILTLPGDQIMDQGWSTRPANLGDFHPSELLGNE